MEANRVFGPVPSRRLGRSIGVNNIPPKICSYSCVYCQLGVSLQKIAARQEFYDPEDLCGEVDEKLSGARDQGLSVDYLTIVSDGEPTLDANLGLLIDRLRLFGFRIAVITNASMLGDPAVRNDLGKADWVSVKIDAVDEQTWKRIDRPHRDLSLDSIRGGISAFTRDFAGFLATETMLVENLNDDVRAVAGFIAEIRPATAYLAVPTRPPAKTWVKAPCEQTLHEAYQAFTGLGLKTELLTGSEGSGFASTGSAEADLLGITAVHPMPEDAVRSFLDRAGADFSVVEKLLRENKITAVKYRGKRYYLRRFRR